MATEATVTVPAERFPLGTVFAQLPDVTWYSTYARARRAEVLTAEYLQECFPEDYVAHLVNPLSHLFFRNCQ